VRKKVDADSAHRSNMAELAGMTLAVDKVLVF